MSSVVPTYGLATLHDYACDEEVKRLELDCEHLRKQITKLSADIQKMFQYLNSYNEQLISEIVELTNQVEALRAKTRDRIKNNSRRFDDLDMEFSGTGSYENESTSYTDEDFEFFYTEASEETFDENKELVALFRRIAARTHPDKTPDKDLHVLFIRAKELRKKGDLEGMRALYEQVINNRTDDLERKRLIEKLKDELARLLATLHHLKTSSDYALYSSYVFNKDDVLSISRRQLTERRDRLYRTLESLRYATDEKALPTVQFLNIIRG